MNEEKSRKILGNTIQKNGIDLNNYCQYMSWQKGDDTICLDGDFNVETLEAIVWWIKNKNE